MSSSKVPSAHPSRAPGSRFEHDLYYPLAVALAAHKQQTSFALPAAACGCNVHARQLELRA